MPRSKRVMGDGLTYHVRSRGNNGEAIFAEDTDRYRYLAMLAEAKSSYRCLLFAYTLMTNHLHLVVQTTKPNISEFVWSVHGRYATEYNRKYGRLGHLFDGRYRSRVIDANEDLLQVTCYVHLNPVRAGLVRRPEDYPWGSFRLYANAGRGESLVDVAPVLGLLARDPVRAALAYVDFVHLAQGRGDELVGSRDRSTGRPTRRSPRTEMSTTEGKEVHPFQRRG